MRTSALMYHDVLTGAGTTGFAGDGPAAYKLPWHVFVEHLERIAEAVAAPPAVADAFAAADGVPTWALTFDDGGASAVAVGAELARRGWRAHFFVTTGCIGRPAFVDAAAVAELHRLGHVVGSHSVTHPERMAALSPTELLHEWRTSVETLSQLLGAPVRSASVPGGYYARKIAVAAARAGIDVLFTSEPVRTPARVDACLVVGRFIVRGDTPAAEAASAAAGDGRTWLRQYVAWNLRKPVKAIGGERYDAGRRLLLARRGRSARQ